MLPPSLRALGTALLLALPAPVTADRALRISELVRAAPYGQMDPLSVNGCLWLEHINMIVGKRAFAEAFYVDFLGFTLDPAGSRSSNSFHLNLGRQQFHLSDLGHASGVEPHVIAGSIGISVPSLAWVRSRLPKATQTLSSTLFSVVEGMGGRYLKLTCPWGNRIYVYEATAPELPEESGYPKQARLQAGLDSGMSVAALPGIRFIEIIVPKGKVNLVGHFYEQLLGANVLYEGGAIDHIFAEEGETHVPGFEEDTRTSLGEDGPWAVVALGPSVHFVFSEGQEGVGLMPEQAAKMSGMHFAMYVSMFKQKYDRLQQLGLVWTNPRFAKQDRSDTWEDAMAGRQFRFQHIVEPGTRTADLLSGNLILELEHEVRAIRHFHFYKAVHYEPKKLEEEGDAANGGEEKEKELAWWASWRENVEEWWATTPFRADLGYCASALGLHLASRLDKLLGRPPSAPRACLVGPCETERDACQWIEERAAELDLPEFPSLPSRFSLPKVLPLPRLLPSVEFIQSHKPPNEFARRAVEDYGVFDAASDQTQRLASAAPIYTDELEWPRAPESYDAPNRVVAKGGRDYTDELEWPRAPSSYDDPYPRVAPNNRVVAKGGRDYTDELEWPRAPSSYDAPYPRVDSEVQLAQHDPDWPGGQEEDTDLLLSKASAQRHGSSQGSGSGGNSSASFGYVGTAGGLALGAAGGLLLGLGLGHRIGGRARVGARRSRREAAARADAQLAAATPAATPMAGSISGALMSA